MSLALVLFANMVLIVMIRHSLRSLKTLNALKKAGTTSLCFVSRSQVSKPEEIL